MEISSKLTLIASGGFFLTGLITGIWKYLSILGSDTQQAPRYINLAHQASLLYSFASLLLFIFLGFSPWREFINLLAVAVPIAFFTLATGTYILHGILRDTENQFQKPYRFGDCLISSKIFHLSVWILIIGEVGGFLVLFIGVLIAFFR